MDLYSVKQDEYFTKVRYDLISLMPANKDLKVLEIGAGGGDTLAYLKKNKLAKEVVGVDIFELDNTNQKNKLIDLFLIKDIERENLDFPKNYFDVIIFGDVLEHLIDPWSVVQKLEVLLKINGKLIVSVPNIRFYKALASIILDGDFKYDPEGGVLDKTHLRFFCKKNLKDMLTLPNFEIQQITAIQKFPGHPMSYKVNLFNKITFRYFEDFFASQFIGVAIKKQ